MKNIVFTRIDDRLIHGQVMTAWLQLSGADEVVIADDKLAKDAFMVNVMSASMPGKIGLKVKDTAGAIKYLTSDKNTTKKIFLLVKTPNELCALADGGVRIPSVCVGGMGAKEGRGTLYRNIHASEEEKQALLDLAGRGIDVFIQVLSEDARVSLEDALK